jgi:cell division ATPase FtsA
MTSMISRLDLTNELLRHEDIEGLLSMGAPDDEYEPEAKMIVDRAGEAESEAPSHRITKEEVEAIVTAVWKEMFGLSEDQLRQRREAFQSIAARLAP